MKYLFVALLLAGCAHKETGVSYEDKYGNHKLGTLHDAVHYSAPHFSQNLTPWPRAVVAYCRDNPNAYFFYTPLRYFEFYVKCDSRKPPKT